MGRRCGLCLPLGLFWMFIEKPLAAPGAARSLNIPLNRCHPWLQILCKYDLLEETAEGYAPSVIAPKTILNVCDFGTIFWGSLCEGKGMDMMRFQTTSEAREKYEILLIEEPEQ